MRSVWRTVLKLTVDAAATIGFFYIAIQPAAYAAGLTVASAISVFSIFSGLSQNIKPDNASFLNAVLLATWMAIYMVLLFAIVMEVMRRLIDDESLQTYLLTAVLGTPIGLSLAGLVGPLRHGAEGFEFTASDAIAIVVLILSGAAAGTVYWLITVKLRAVLTLLLKRLLCSAEPTTASCVFS